MKRPGFRTTLGAAVFALLPAALAVRCASSPPAASPGSAPPPSSAAPDAPSSSALVGEWGIQIKFFEHTVDGTLRFTREGRALLGSFTDDEGNQSELEKLHVAEGKISWEMDRKDGRLSAKGTIEGTIISGKMKLHRNRDEDSGVGMSGGSASAGGYSRRIGEPDSFAFTAVRRAQTTAAPAPPSPPN